MGWCSTCRHRHGVDDTCEQCLTCREERADCHRIEVVVRGPLHDAQSARIWIGSAIEGRYLLDVVEVSLTPVITEPT